MIYIVEDDENIREIERYALRGSGFEALAFESAETFYRQLKEKLPKLIVLDIMLPKEDGLSVLKKLRENDSTKEIPVIIVSAKTEELDRVRGLDAGADDYLVKPFGVMEFISRVRALLRRLGEQKEKTLIAYGGIVLNDEKHIVEVAGEPCILTFKEYELLKLLISTPGRVFSRDVLLKQIWDCDSSIESRTVDMHIKTLRQKLGQSANVIKTIRNVGYKAET